MLRETRAWNASGVQWMDSRTACSASALAERWRCGGSTSGRARALSRRCGTGRIGAAPTAGSELRAADDSRSLVSSGEIIGPIFPPTGGPAARRLQLAACFIFTCARQRCDTRRTGGRGRWQQGDRSRSPEAVTYQPTPSSAQNNERTFSGGRGTKKVDIHRGYHGKLVRIAVHGKHHFRRTNLQFPRDKL
jgi:hypothetical protein